MLAFVVVSRSCSKCLFISADAKWRLYALNLITITGVCHMGQFDGEGFSELIVIIILVVLFFYGSNDIETLTGAPTSDN